VGLLGSYTRVQIAWGTADADVAAAQTVNHLLDIQITSFLVRRRVRHTPLPRLLLMVKVRVSAVLPNLISALRWLDVSSGRNMRTLLLFLESATRAPPILVLAELPTVRLSFIGCACVAGGQARDQLQKLLIIVQHGLQCISWPVFCSLRAHACHRAPTVVLVLY
jgi:hypothetical protein